MYNNMQDEIFESLLTIALTEYMKIEHASLPSDKELAEMYPIKPKMIKKYIRIVKAQKYNMPLTLVYLRRAAVVLLAAISLTFGVFMTNAGVRAAIADTVVQWYDKYVNIDFKNIPADTTAAETDGTPTDETSAETEAETQEQIADVNSLSIGYIPEKFMLASSTEKDTRKEYIYMADDGDYIMIGIYSTKMSESDIDNEHTEYEELQINNNKAYLLYNKDEKSGVLTFGNLIYTVSISGITEKDELIKIAENIK